MHDLTVDQLQGLKVRTLFTLSMRSKFESSGSASYSRAAFCVRGSRLRFFYFCKNVFFDILLKENLTSPQDNRNKGKRKKLLQTVTLKIYCFGSGSAIRKNVGFGSALNQCGSETLYENKKNIRFDSIAYVSVGILAIFSKFKREPAVVNCKVMIDNTCVVLLNRANRICERFSFSFFRNGTCN